jgi:hypothetical protein
VQLQAAVGDLVLQLGRPPLGHRRVDGGELAGVELADALVDEGPGDRHLGVHLGEHEAGVLERADRPAERRAPCTYSRVSSSTARRRRPRRRRSTAAPAAGSPSGGRSRGPPRRAGWPPAPRTSSKNSSAVSCALRPILSRLRPRSKPGMPRSTTSRLMPGAGSGSVRATTITRSALMPLVMKVFEPLSTQSSPSRGPWSDALQVAAGARLGHRDRGDQLAAAEAGQPALLLLLGGQVAQVGATTSLCRPKPTPLAPTRVISSSRTRCSGSRAPRRRRTPPRRPCRAGPARPAGEPDLARHDAGLLPHPPWPAIL